MILFLIDSMIKKMNFCAVIVNQVPAKPFHEVSTVKPTTGSITSKDSLHEKYTKNRKEIHKLIIDEVIEWRFFGRLLDISDSELGHWAAEYRGSIKLITFRILDEAEKKYANQTVLKILEALEGIRRKDIANKIRRM